MLYANMYINNYDWNICDEIPKDTEDKFHYQRSSIIFKDTKMWFPKTKMIYQRQRCTKDVPKTEALRKDVWDTDYKDKDAKDKLDIFP